MQPRHYLACGLFAATLVSTASALAGADKEGDSRGPSICAKSAQVLKQACLTDTSVNYGESSAVCLNLTNAAARKDCYATARQDKVATTQDCRETFEARQELCEELGGAAYEPPFGGAFAPNFVDPLGIGAGVAPNVYYPLVPGSKRVYAGGDEVITVTVTHKTKLIDGVTCLVVNDVVEVNGAVVEDTDDWFAQDVTGNVWYCGESVRDFETFEGDAPAQAELVAIDGSWKAGRDGAKAGIVMPAEPSLGDFVRLELTWGEAEDAFEVIDVTASASTPAASCAHECVLTRDFTPLAPQAQENKYYAPGVGLIIEVNVVTGERVELIEFTTP
jgi:hypothetical protein